MPKPNIKQMLKHASDICDSQCRSNQHELALWVLGRWQSPRGIVNLGDALVTQLFIISSRVAVRGREYAASRSRIHGAPRRMEKGRRLASGASSSKVLPAW